MKMFKTQMGECILNLKSIKLIIHRATLIDIAGK